MSKFPHFASASFLGRMFERNWISTISATIMRASLLKKIGGFDESFPLAEDYDLYLRIGRTAKVDYVDLPLVRNRRHHDNVSNDWQTYKEYQALAIKKHEPAEIASQLSRVYKNEEEFRLAFGRVLYRMGLARQALRHFQKANKINTSNEDAYFFSGICYFQAGKYKKADEEYSKCLALNPQHAGCLNNLGVLYFHLGERKRSVTELQRAAKYGENSSEPKHNLACIKDKHPRENLRLSILGVTQLQAEMEYQSANGFHITLD